MGSGRKINLSKNTEIRDFLSHPLWFEIRDKYEILYGGKIFKNLKGMIFVKFRRLQNLFETGVWINNKRVRKNLENEIVKIQITLKPKLIPPEIERISSQIAEIKAVCKLLKESHLNPRPINEIVAKFEALEKQFNNWLKFDRFVQSKESVANIKLKPRLVDDPTLIAHGRRLKNLRKFEHELGLPLRPIRPIHDIDINKPKGEGEKKSYITIRDSKLLESIKKRAKF